MKALLLLLPGACEPVRAELDGRTALGAAPTPALDALASAGRVGRVLLAPAGRLPEDGSALLSLLGYDPRRERPGRGALEAAGLGVELGEHDLALRLDLLTTWRGRLVDPWAGGIGPAEARLLIQALARELDDEQITLHPGRGPRNLLHLRGGAALELASVPPGRVPAGEIAAHSPRGADGALLRELMERAVPVLARHDVNRVRADLGERVADAVWPWGPGRRIVLEPFELRTGRSLAVLAHGAAPRGLGRLVGAGLPPLPSTQDGLPVLVRTTLAALHDHDVVLLHVDGPGEATPGTLAELDRGLVAPLARECARRRDVRLLLSTDRPSPALPPSTPVPFLAWGAGIDAGRATAFSEQAAAASDLLVEQGHAILDHLLGTGHPDRHPEPNDDQHRAEHSR